MNNLAPYHAKYFAYELTKRSSSDSMQKLASTLVDAQVDLNPHQVDAALFAFRSPLSKGAILADEVGLGKTIEAGLVISLKWTERKRKINIKTPANLRKQWSQELKDKFFLNSVILEAKSFNEFIKKRKFNPFDQQDIVISSYQFARTKEPYLKQIKWDLAVVDEAHRLRNVYKANNKIAKSINNSLLEAPKILLTATPLQNTLLERYGLVSIIDDDTFGDLKSFKTQYSRSNNGAEAETFYEVKERLKTICKRTLRRQVLEYIRYTNRITLVEEFYPTEDEQRLYDMVSNYLQADNLYALPACQRKLMTLILRRLLASSTFAFSGTLEGLANKLEGIVKESKTNNAEEVFALDFEICDEIKDEWESEEDEEQEKEKKTFTQQDIENIRTEIDSLKEFDGFYDTSERLDLLAIDKQGNFVIIENKIDDAERDVTWLVLKYSSFCSTLNASQIIAIYNQYLQKIGSTETAEEMLEEFLETEDYKEKLNNGNSQLIMMIAEEFRKEVTSTVLWLLNYGLRLQCFKATPFRLNEQLFLNMEQIIPIKEAEEFVISMANKSREEIGTQELMKERHIVRRKFWAAYFKEINKATSLYQNVSPGKDHWISAGSGISGVTFTSILTGDYIRIELSINGKTQEENKAIFDALESQKDKIEAAFVRPLEWERLSDKRISRIKYQLSGVSVFNEEDWNKMFEFMVQFVPKFEVAFKKPIQLLSRKQKDYVKLV